MDDHTPHPNIETLRAVYADFSRLAEYASDDVVVHSHGSRGILTGDYAGKQAVLAKEMELHRRSGGSLEMTADHIVANDHFGAVLGQFRATRDGQEFAGEVCGLWRFRDGVIVEHWENCADWPAAERFFLDGFDAAAEPVGAPHAAT